MASNSTEAKFAFEFITYNSSLNYATNRFDYINDDDLVEPRYTYFCIKNQDDKLLGYDGIYLDFAEK